MNTRAIDESPVRVLERRIAERTAELVRANDALRESEAFSRGVFESSPDCVKVLDDRGRLLSMNRNGLCAMEIDDFAPLQGRDWCDLWPEEGKADVQAALERARAGGTGRFQRYCPTAKGTPRWWDVLVAPIRNANGHIVRFVSVSRDITDRQRVEEALRKSEIRQRESGRRAASTGFVVVRGRPSQERIPRDAGPRAAQSALGDQQCSAGSRDDARQR